MSELIKEKKTHFSSGDIASLVRKKYDATQYVVLEEVREATGYGAGRSADAVAFSIWPSRGLTITGFEFKSARADWLNELKNPAKAESIARHCDSWWLIATEHLAKLEEIPATWGWYVPTEKGLKAMKQPIMAEGDARVPRPFLMSLLRNCRDTSVPKAEVRRLAEEQAVALADHRAGLAKSSVEEFKRVSGVLADFKAASGIDLAEKWGYPSFPPKMVGAAVKAIVEGRLATHIKNVENAAEAARGMLEKFKALPLEFKSDD